MSEITCTGRLDVSDVHCRDKFGMIMARWDSLQPGQSFLLVNSHDPLPLYYQFTTQFAGEFDWVYEERGPAVFAIRITRLPEGAEQAPGFTPPADAPAAGGCAAPRSGIDVDARGLQPPEPMQRIVEALAGLAPGGELRALTDRRPVHLVPMLEARGFSCASEERPDGSWVNFIRHAGVAR